MVLLARPTVVTVSVRVDVVEETVAAVGIIVVGGTTAMVGTVMVVGTVVTVAVVAVCLLYTSDAADE